MNSPQIPHPLVSAYRVLLCLAVCGLAGCAGDPLRPAPAARACCAKEAAAVVPLPDTSIYQLESVWKPDTGGSLKLKSLAGRPQVVTLFFASCQVACPILVNDLKRLEAALPEELRGRVGFVLVSIDPERDTPAALAAYRKAHRLPPSWTLLHGEAADVLELAAVLGVNYKRDASGQFAHSNLITVLNARGEVATRLVGLNQPVEEIAAQLAALVRP
jgi:protein SCO1/2